LGRVADNQINHLISQSLGTFQNPYFSNYRFNEENIADLTEEQQIINGSDPAKAAYSTYDFTKSIVKKTSSDPSQREFRHGLFFLHARGWDPKWSRDLGDEDKRLILITDLGILVKDNANKTHDVFVQSISTGDPCTGVVVDVLAKSGVTLLSVTTDSDGHAAFPSLAGFSRDKEPVAYIARKAEDLSFLPFQRNDRILNFSRFDTSGIYPERSSS